MGNEQPVEEPTEQEIQDAIYGSIYESNCKWGLTQLNRTFLDGMESEGASFTMEEITCDVVNDDCLLIPTRITGYTQTIFLYFSLAFAGAICFSYVIYSKERVPKKKR